MSERDPQHTIYLDLDGVIFPYWRQSTDDIAEEAYWANRDEFYYPAFTKRLGSIAARGAEIIVSSSRSLDLFIHYPTVRKDLGGVEKFLKIDTFEPARIDHKAEADETEIIRDQEVIAAFDILNKISEG